MGVWTLTLNDKNVTDNILIGVWNTIPSNQQINAVLMESPLVNNTEVYGQNVYDRLIQHGKFEMLMLKTLILSKRENGGIS